MVELRTRLWRIPTAFTAMVQAARREVGAGHEARSGKLYIPLVCQCGVFFEHPTDRGQFLLEHRLANGVPFAGLTRILRKDWLWRHYKKMLARFGPDHFSFLPECLFLPQQAGELRAKITEDPDSFWIVKPPGRSMGRGIYLINTASDIPSVEVMVQRYLPDPYLIHGCKFDLRIYVLLTSIEPLRIYIYKEGLVRFCVNEFTMDPTLIKDNRIHVCNYDVNRTSKRFTVNEDPLRPQGHKWTLTALWKFLSTEHHERAGLTPQQIWTKIEEVVVKSILCGLPSFKQEVNSMYNMSKLLGYDILLDSRRTPHLIEANCGPACHSARLDAFVNRPMISEMFRIVGYHLPPGALANNDSTIMACRKLNISEDTSKAKLVFNPALYSLKLDAQSVKKQARFSKDEFGRDSYKDDILKELTANDVRILIKTSEEFSQTDLFSRVFPSPTSHQYFQYLPTLSYSDKLVDAFVSRYADSNEEGISFVDKYCQRNVHLI